MIKKKSKAAASREQLRDEFFPDAGRAWLGQSEKGYFCVPRTLPLVLSLLRIIGANARTDIVSVYMELLSRNMGEGFVELSPAEDHAYASGYNSTRAKRSWTERMKVLEEVGLIKTIPRGNRPYGYAFLVHPTLVVHQLKEDGEVPDDWWRIYRARQLEVREPSAEELIELENLFK